MVYAIHNFQAKNPDEMSFSAGVAIQVTKKDDQYGDGWWQLHLPSPTANSFPLHYSHPINSNSSSRSPSKSNQFQPSKDEDKMTSPSIKSPTDWNLSNTNPTQARAFLAQKAKTQSQNQSKVTQKLQSVSDHPLHLRASIRTQDFDEIELSEESDDEDQNQFLTSSFNSLTNHQSINSRGCSQSPFSAAEFALGLTDPSKPKFSPPSNQTNHEFQKSHQANKLSSSSLLSDPGINPRDHSTPLATVLPQLLILPPIKVLKLRGLDDFTLEKFVEHEIKGDLLLELDVDSLKEINLSAFGRTVRVMKAIEELKTISQTHHQPHPAISPFFDQNQSSSSPDPAGSTHSHQIPSRNEVDGPLTVNQNCNSSFTSPNNSNLKYQHQSYYPTPDTNLDAGQEELAPHLSQNPLVSKQSSIQLHQKQPSDPLVGVTKETSKPQHDETQPDLKLLEGICLSSSGAHARQITFSHTEASKANQTCY
ncbi:hypothetical protein O181_013333 [Austropuccinia psidii MF-1]|uniref:SAM domain-containing protein n=1 Tax=Austropuccinia psidii MF-1 TaxID=1389203 RepID=A0A9Q3GN07_9BASI|nr:hypothetical protein [Austropuccinia psidii MF-1]